MTRDRRPDHSWRILPPDHEIPDWDKAPDDWQPKPLFEKSDRRFNYEQDNFS